MNINATLLVQAGNFFIAYLLFRYILLKPGYAALRQKEAYYESLEQAIAQDERSVEKERERQRHAWIEFRAWCSEYRPAWIDRVLLFKGISRTIQPKEISNKNAKDLVEDAKRRLQEIDYVYVTEKFDEALIVMKKQLGWRKNPYYKRLNVSKHKLEISPEEEKLIKTTHKYDFELYELAKERHEKAIKNMGQGFGLSMRVFNIINRLRS